MFNKQCLKNEVGIKQCLKKQGCETWLNQPRLKTRFWEPRLKTLFRKQCLKQCLKNKVSGNVVKSTSFKNKVKRQEPCLKTMFKTFVKRFLNDV